MFKTVRISAAIGACLLSVGCSDADSGSRRGEVPLRVDVYSPQQDYMMFEPVLVTLRVTNLSGRTKFVAVGGVLNGLGTISIRDPDGNQLVPDLSEVASSLGVTRVALEADDAIYGNWLLHYSFLGKGRFLFSKPGRYEIQGRCSDVPLEANGRDRSGMVAYSASLAINVTEPAGENKAASDLFCTDPMAHLLFQGEADEESLRRCTILIDEYPATTYAQYARYAMGWHFQRKAAQQRESEEELRLLDQSADLFEALLNDSPTFALAPHVRYAIAKAHYLKGRNTLRQMASQVEWLGALGSYREGFAVSNP